MEFEALRQHGFTDEQILEAVVMTGCINFFNILSLGLGTKPEFKPGSTPELPSNCRRIVSLLVKVFPKDNDIVIVTASPGIENQCRVFTRNFRGTVGPDSKVTLQLTRKGSTLSGTHQYVRIGKTLWLKGQVDSFGKFILEEQYPQNRVTGIFKGRFSLRCRTMTGYFSKARWISTAALRIS